MKKTAAELERMWQRRKKGSGAYKVTLDPSRGVKAVLAPYKRTHKGHPAGSWVCHVKEEIPSPKGSASVWTRTVHTFHLEKMSDDSAKKLAAQHIVTLFGMGVIAKS